jgi:hypothetical protein
MTTNTPNAKRSCTNEDLKMSKSVERVKNSGLLMPIEIESKIIAMIKAVSLRSKSFFQFMA